MREPTTLEYLMDVPLYVHLMEVPSLLERVGGEEHGKALADKYQKRIYECKGSRYEDGAFLNTIRYAKKYLKDELKATEDEGYYLSLIVMPDWKKDRSHPESADAAFEGPASENAYPETQGIMVGGKFMSMNDMARAYNRSAHMTDEYADVSYEDQVAAGKDEKAEGEDKGQQDRGEGTKGGATLEILMGAKPLVVLQIMPAMLELVGDAEQGRLLVEEFYELAQEGDREGPYRNTIMYAKKYLEEELEATEDEEYYLALVR